MTGNSSIDEEIALENVAHPSPEASSQDMATVTERPLSTTGDEQSSGALNPLDHTALDVGATRSPSPSLNRDLQRPCAMIGTEEEGLMPTNEASFLTGHSQSSSTATMRPLLADWGSPQGSFTSPSMNDQDRTNSSPDPEIRHITEREA